MAMVMAMVMMVVVIVAFESEFEMDVHVAGVLTAGQFRECFRELRLG